MAEERRTWLPIGLAAGFALTGVVVVLVTAQFNKPVAAPTCATSVKASSPFLPPERFDEDEHLVALGSAIDRMTAPFGPVRAGVGYNYDQWLHLYGVAGGLLAFTKDNAALTLLDETSLKARWALRPATKRIAWDTSDKSLALLDLSSKQRVRVGSYDLVSGHERWCIGLTTRHRDGQPVSTAFLDDGDLLVVLPTASGLGVARMSAKDGRVLWFNGLEGVGRADFVAQVGGDRFVVGGVEAFRLGETAGRGEKPGFGVFALKDGRRTEDYAEPIGGRVHVVGLQDDLVVTLVKTAAHTRLEGDGLNGKPHWTTALPDATVDVTLRDGIVLARSKTALLAYRAENGKLLWSDPIPVDRTYIPYGFTLSQMPSLDKSHVLVPTTTALQVLDVATGEHEDFALPVDGVSTTYWPYQLLVTAKLFGVVTNTGGILADRDVGAVG